MAILRPVRRRGDSCPYESNRFIARPLISYPVSMGLFSICTMRSVGAHLEKNGAPLRSDLGKGVLVDDLPIDRIVHGLPCELDPLADLCCREPLGNRTT